MKLKLRLSRWISKASRGIIPLGANAHSFAAMFLASLSRSRRLPAGFAVKGGNDRPETRDIAEMDFGGDEVSLVGR